MKRIFSLATLICSYFNLL